MGHEVNGARRWIRAGSFGVQVSDFAKLAVILFLAQHLGKHREWRAFFLKGTVPVMAAVAALTGLVVIEPDFGTALFLLGLGGVLAVAGGIRWLHLAPPFLVGLPAMAFLVWQKFDHVKDRVAVFLDPSLDPLILALVGEEMGLAGTILVLACFLALFAASLAIAKKARSASGYLIALGVGLMVGMQGFINIAVVTASVPTKGISLPFVSYGGSSLVVMMAGLGLLLNVAKESGMLEGRPRFVPDDAPEALQRAPA